MQKEVGGQRRWRAHLERGGRAPAQVSPSALRETGGRRTARGPLLLGSGQAGWGQGLLDGGSLPGRRSGPRVRVSLCLCELTYAGRVCGERVQVGSEVMWAGGAERVQTTGAAGERQPGPGRGDPGREGSRGQGGQPARGVAHAWVGSGKTGGTQRTEVGRTGQRSEGKGLFSPGLPSPSPEWGLRAALQGWLFWSVAL